VFYDVRSVRTKTLTLSLENGRVERVKWDESSGKAFRVLNNGFWGFYSTSEDVSDEEGIRRAKENAVGKGDASVVEVDAKDEKFVLKPKIPPWDVPVEEKLKLLREIEGVLRDGHVVSTRIVYMENVREFEYRDCCGVTVRYSVPRVGIVVQAVAKGESLQMYSKRIFKPAGYEIFGDNVFEMAEEVRKVLEGLVKAKTPPSGRMNVVIDPSLGGVFIHEAFGHAAEADHVAQGSSVLAGRIGERVADEGVNVYDDPTLEEFGFYPFDDEGVRAERRAIVENGILRGFLHSRETASKLGGRPGNARAQGLDFPIVRMSNTFIGEGDFSFEELLEEAREGVYLVGSRGGETNPATGYFQFNAQYGYVIRNGELGEMIRDVALSGNTLEVLRDIRVGRGLEFDPGFCGKAGQIVPVADGSPPALIRALVGGA